MKTCTKCGQEKPDDYFHKDARSEDGLHTYCKQCRMVYWKKRLSKRESQRAVILDVLKDIESQLSTVITTIEENTLLQDIPFPDQIRLARKSQGLTQKELATKLGTTVTTVCYWETGRQSPNYHYTEKLKIFINDAKHE